MQNSVAVGTAERGLSPSRINVPGKCSGPLGDSEHVLDRLASNLKYALSMLHPRCAVVARSLLLSREGGTTRELLGLRVASTPVALLLLTSAHQNCTSGEICPPPTDPRDLVSAGVRSP